MSLKRPQRVQQKQTNALLQGKVASIAAWQLAACARVRVVVSMAEAQLRNLVETNLTLRWSVALTVLRMMSRISLGTLLKAPKHALLVSDLHISPCKKGF